MDNIDKLYKIGVESLKTLGNSYQKSKAKVESMISIYIDSNPLLYGAGYTTFINDLDKELLSLAKTQSKLMAASLSSVYLKGRGELSPFPNNVFIPQEKLNKIISQQWAGRTFSHSIWKNTEKLKKRLIKDIQDIVVSGQSKDKAVAAVRAQFNSSFAAADALVRTETQFFINQSQKDSYIERGFTHYKYLATKDDRTSGICSSLNGKTFAFADAVVGENFPPAHVNCRSTITPVINN